MTGRSDHPELIESRALLSSARSAPWTIWVFAFLNVGQRIAEAAESPRLGQVVPILIAVFFSAILLGGARALWQIAIFFEVAGLVLFFGRSAPTWVAGAELAALLVLLLPASRRYFSPGRAVIPAGVMARLQGSRWAQERGFSAEEILAKGSLRYLGLTESIPAFLAPREVRAFCMTTRDRRLTSQLSHLLHREWVVAVTDHGVSVLRMRLPPAMTRKPKNLVIELPVDDPSIGWDDDRIRIAGHEYLPLRWHEDDARAVIAGIEAGRSLAG